MKYLFGISSLTFFLKQPIFIPIKSVLQFLFFRTKLISNKLSLYSQSHSLNKTSGRFCFFKVIICWKEVLAFFLGNQTKPKKSIVLRPNWLEKFILWNVPRHSKEASEFSIVLSPALPFEKTINKSLEKNKVRETILTICFDHSSVGYFKSDKIKSAEILWDNKIGSWFYVRIINSS